MTARTLTILWCSLVLAGARAQTAPPTPGDEAKPELRELPPDQRAYNEALKITDTETKIEALEKIRKDFPDSVYASSADSLILSTLIEKTPKDEDRIRKRAKQMFSEAAAKDKAASKDSVIVTTANRGSAANRIADGLLDGGVLLKDAESYALGDVVTWAGGAWHCNLATDTRPGESSDVWTLMVKRGRDARGAR